MQKAHNSGLSVLIVDTNPLLLLSHVCRKRGKKGLTLLLRNTPDEMNENATTLAANPSGAEEWVSLPSGFIYLLHWQDRQGRVEHYVGWTTNLPARLKAHYSTNGGCPTTRKYRQARMGGRLVRLWTGTKRGERKLQQTLDFPQDCPYCCGKVIETIPCEGWIEAEEND